jgi:hypothetical protein
MATETQSQRQAHILAVTRTGLAALTGVLAAFGSWYLTQDLPADEAALHQSAQLLVLAAILLQIPLQKALGIYKEDFGAKDFLFILFITFSMWFVTWTIILTADAHAAADASSALAVPLFESFAVHARESLAAVANHAAVGRPW